MSLLDTASLIVTPNGYKEGKLYSVIPSDGSGDMSVVRATTATRVNSQGLVELVPYNLVNYSEQFDNAAWLKAQSTITANSTISPSGLQNADTLTADGTNNEHTIRLTGLSTLTSGTTYTTSIYAKKGTNNFIQLVGTSAVYPTTTFANFDLNNGVIGSFGVNVISTITDVGNGWYRCSMTADAILTSNINTFIVSIVPSATSPRGEINTLNTNVFIWGAQANEGTILPYQKTETRLNIPRLDYSNGTCPSILVEPQRTNLALWSSSFDNAAWVKLNGGTSTLPVVTANSAISPDGTQNADRIQCSADTSSASNFSLVGTNASPTLSATGTFTIYLKSNTASNQNVLIYWSAGQGQVFSVTPEWQRFTLSNLTAGTAGIRFGTRGGSGDFFNGGDATLDILAYGVQLEVGSYATSYIPTTSASVTRNADVISKTGISSLIGQTEGTLFLDFVPQSKDFQIFYQVRTTGSTNVGQVDIRYQSSNLRALGNDNALTQFNISAGDIVIGQRYKCAVRYQLDNVAFYVNGALAGTDSSATFASSSKEQVAFCDNLGNFIPQAEINAAVLWDTALTNDQLATLTTL